MAVNVVIFVIAILIAAIWILYGFKRMKHRFLAIILIALVLFSFLSFGIVFKGENISVENISDFGNVARLYLSWLGSVFGNFKMITANAVKMDWRGNSTDKTT